MKRDGRVAVAGGGAAGAPLVRLRRGQGPGPCGAGRAERAGVRPLWAPDNGGEAVIYTWGYHGSETEHVHVALSLSHVTPFGPLREELFDVTLYDRDYDDARTGLNAEDASLLALRTLLGLANAALAAGLEPLPVPDKATDDYAEVAR